MTRKLFVAAFVLYLAVSHDICSAQKLIASGGMIFAPAKPPSVVLEERYKANTTKLDIGTPADLFDGEGGKLIRTPSINPAFVEIVFDESVSSYGLRIETIAAKHEFTLAAAANAEDLHNKTGTYKLLKSGITDQSGDVVFVSTKPISYAAFRLDIKRLEGDDYVHISEWQFLEPVKLKSMTVEYKVRTSHGDGEKAIYMPFDDNATRPADSLFLPKIIAETEDGRKFDASAIAVLSSTSKSVKKWQYSTGLVLTKPGKIPITVKVGNLTKTASVTVTPRTYKNRELDLDALFVERLPRIDFDGKGGGWPVEGQKVIWRAHVQNWGRKDVTSAYVWKLDGQTVGEGTITIPAGKIVTVDLPWRWEKKRHNLLFEINPDKSISEFVKHNNRVEFATDALAVGFYVDRSYADQFHETQYKLGLDDSNSFADWGQRQIRQWNKMLANSRYPEAPNGALDRVRLDLVRVVPDQAIPFQGGDWPTNFPNLEEKTVDLLWGFPYKFDQWKENVDFEQIKKDIAAGKLSTHWFFLDLALIHELSHARYLIDTYGLDVNVGDSKDPDKSNIRIKDDQGRWIVGIYLQKEGIVHWNKYEGNMGGPYEIYGPYEVVMLNRVAGQRAQGGNCNGTSNIGVFLQDIPKQFKIKFVGQNGELLTNAPVKVYWAAPGDGWYAKVYDNVPDREFKTDDDGTIITDKYFFASDGVIIHTYGHSNAVPIVRIDYEGKTYYVFVEVTEVNMLANTSKEAVPMLTVTVPLRSGEPEPLPADYGRRQAPDWRLRTSFERLDY